MTAEAIISLVIFIFGIGSAWANLSASVKSIQKILNDDLTPRISGLSDRFLVVEDRVTTLWQDRLAPTQSLRALNQRGMDIQNRSGVRQIVDEHMPQLEAMLESRNPKDEYDVAREAIACVMAIPQRMPELVPRLKAEAFHVGADVDEILLAGGLYFRDLLLLKEQASAGLDA
jgi:hypothetical protein